MEEKGARQGAFEISMDRRKEVESERKSVISLMLV